MFTGIVESVGVVGGLEEHGADRRLRIDGDVFEGAVLGVGDSVSVSGVCLTANALSASGFYADVSAETLACTTIGALRIGDKVNLERALTPAAARDVMAAFDGVSVKDDPATASFPQPIEVTGEDDVFVGRVRESRVFDPGLTFWLVGDQLLKGAALNAVQIAECL